MANEPEVSEFGRLLKGWRHARGFSQLNLALDADVSARHLSFIENGRSRPSRDMVLRLLDALEVPLRERNTFLNAAGFADIYRASELADDTLAPARHALSFMLKKHEPYPAFVIDRLMNVLMANDACQTLLGLCGIDGLNEAPIAGNILRLTMHPDGLRPMIENWDEIATVVMHRMQREAAAAFGDDPLKSLLEEVLAYPEMPDFRMISEAVTELNQPVIPMVVNVSGQRLSFSTIIATFGTPQDVTLQEIRLETLTPADTATAQFFENLP